MATYYTVPNPNGTISSNSYGDFITEERKPYLLDNDYRYMSTNTGGSYANTPGMGAAIYGNQSTGNDSSSSSSPTWQSKEDAMSWGSTMGGSSSPYNSGQGRYYDGGGNSSSPYQMGALQLEKDKFQLEKDKFAYGKTNYNAALVDWNKVYADAKQGIPAALKLIDEFAIGGSYGQGRRTEANDLINQGVAQDSANAVAAGMSSISSSRGLNVLAGAQKATQYANIEDERARLEVQAFQPYTQMLANLAQVGTSRPQYYG